MKFTKKGYTLVEVLIAMFIMSLITMILFNFLRFGFKVSKSSNSEFQLQSAMRISAETIKNQVQNAESIYIIPEDSFTHAKLTKGWHYFGVQKNDMGSTQIVQYEYNPTKVDNGDGFPMHDRRVFAESGEDIDYKINFSDASINAFDNRLNFTIDGMNNGLSENISSQINALNSLKIQDNTSGGDLGVAIAYRNDSADVNASGLTIIEMMLDVSGSMKFSMDNKGGTVPLDKQRTYFLRSAMTKFIDAMQNNDNVYIGLQKFESVAYEISNIDRDNGMKEFFELSGSDLNKLYEIFNPENYLHSPAYDYIAPDGRTNIGDAYRIGYLNLLNVNNASSITEGFTEDEIKNFLILVSDGEATDLTIDYNYDLMIDELNAFPMDPVNAPVPGIGKKENIYFGKEYAITLEDARYIPGNVIMDVFYWKYGGHPRSSEFESYYYANAITERIKNRTLFGENLKVDDNFIIVIGKSEDAALISHISNIADTLDINNDKHVFYAHNPELLAEAFEKVSENIQEQIEYFSGPNR